MPEWDISDEIPPIAVNLRQNYPPRDSWDTIGDGGLDGRSGDLISRLRLARDNNQVLELEAGATYELSEGLHYYDVAETGLICNEDNPARVVYTGTDSASIFTSHNGGCDTFVFQGVEIDITEGDADVGLVRGVYGTEFWSKGVTLTGQRDREYGQRANYTFAPFIGDPSGTCYVGGLSMMDGDYPRPDAHFGDHSIAVSTDPDHVGTAVYWGCELSGFGDNNFYMANSPDGRAILVDCYSANCRGGAFRMGTDDEVIGGVAEQYDGPLGLNPNTPAGEGPGHCLSAYYGSPRRFVGVTCRGDLYGNAMILSRDDENATPSTTLDRCVVHVDGDNASPLLRMQGGAEWEFIDCYFYDEDTSGRDTASIQDGCSFVTDDTMHWDSAGSINLRGGTSLTHNGTTHTGPDSIHPSDLGYLDPTPLPEPHFGSGGTDPGGEQDDRLVIARNSETQDREQGVEVWVRPR